MHTGCKLKIVSKVAREKMFMFQTHFFTTDCFVLFRGFTRVLDVLFFARFCRLRAPQRSAGFTRKQFANVIFAVRRKPSQIECGKKACTLEEQLSVPRMHAKVFVTDLSRQNLILAFSKFSKQSNKQRRNKNEAKTPIQNQYFLVAFLSSNL